MRTTIRSQRVGAYARRVYLAGIRVRDDEVLDLARALRRSWYDDIAERLELAYVTEIDFFALTIDDRDAILRALHDPHGGLARLRRVLVHEYAWRVREGLSSDVRVELPGGLDSSH
jgi:hypothetical protein